MKSRAKRSALLCIGSAALCLLTGCGSSGPDMDALLPTVDVSIDPDYTHVHIPPNIAPLNFNIQEPADAYCVRISGLNGLPIQWLQSSSAVLFSTKAWKNLLAENVGDTLTINIALKQDGIWSRSFPFRQIVSKDSIDPVLVYRLLNPMYYIWQRLSLHERSLEYFEERTLIHNRMTENNCYNCHSFAHYKPDHFMMHIRARGSGLYIQTPEKQVRVDTRTAFNQAAAAYPSWHPEGKKIAFSVNNLGMFFHARGDVREIIDMMSDLILYEIDNNTVTTIPAISDPEYLETFPCWSPDGRHLYFCRTPKLAAHARDPDQDADLMYKDVRYDLMRIAYDSETRAWGDLETVLHSEEVDGSITIPRISPDGRFLLFCVSDHGNFPVYIRSSDLWMLDLHNGKTWKLTINSTRSDSYHSWSSNGRWIVFSSKRGDGQTARPYFAHVSADGKVDKPFVLPQKDPELYRHQLKTYNLPEFLTTPMELTPQQIRKIVYDSGNLIQAELDPAVTHRNKVEDAREGWSISPYSF